MDRCGRVRGALCTGAVALGCLMLMVSPAMASTLSFTVTTTADTHDVNPGDGTCSDGSGRCSLRAAIEASNGQPKGSLVTVTLPAGTYQLTLGTLTITANTLIITGAGASTTVVKQTGTGAVVSVGSGAVPTFAQLKLTGGRPGAPGGGLYNSGTTNLNHDVVTGNTARLGAGITNTAGATLSLTGTSVSHNSIAGVANSQPGGSGGGILNAGTLTMTGASVTGNYAGEGGLGTTDTGGVGGNGGGISNTGTVKATSTKISGNYAGTGGPGNNEVPGQGGSGGGIYNSGTGTASLTSVSVTGNFAGQAGTSETGDGIANAGNGGGVDNAAKLTVAKSSFSGNTGAMGGLGSDGGGIYNSGTATISTSTFSSNVAGTGYATRSGYGGGIANRGTLTLATSTLSGNAAGTGGSGVNGLPGGNGGGLYQAAGTATLSGDTLTGNTSGEGGPGVFVDGGFSYGGPGGTGGGIYSMAALTVTDSTVSGNNVGIGGANAPPLGGSGSPGIGGGVAVNGGSTKLSYVTVADNSDGIDAISGATTLTGTIVADSTGSSDRTANNCTGTIAETSGFNLDSGTTCAFSLASDLSGVEPLLAPLAANGGPTQTQAVQTGSPAIDHGGTAPGCPTTDQRGLSRPDEAGDSGACDIGAYESQGVA